MILQHCILPIANYIANYIRTYFILHNVIVCDFLVIAHAQCTSAIPCVEPTFDSSFISSPVCTCVYCQRLIHAHRKNHRRQISIVQINDFQWRGWSLGWSYYYNSQCIALQWQTMVAGLVITITMAHDGAWDCEPVVVALHTNAQRHHWQLFWTFLELFATKWIPLFKNSFG